MVLARRPVVKTATRLRSHCEASGSNGLVRDPLPIVERRQRAAHRSRHLLCLGLHFVFVDLQTGRRTDAGAVVDGGVARRRWQIKHRSPPGCSNLQFCHHLGRCSRLPKSQLLGRQPRQSGLHGQDLMVSNSNLRWGRSWCPQRFGGGGNVGFRDCALDVHPLPLDRMLVIVLHHKLHRRVAQKSNKPKSTGSIRSAISLNGGIHHSAVHTEILRQSIGRTLVRQTPHKNLVRLHLVLRYRKLHIHHSSIDDVRSARASALCLSDGVVVHESKSTGLHSLVCNHCLGHAPKLTEVLLQHPPSGGGGQTTQEQFGRHGTNVMRVCESKQT
mmetsp:Transcript_27442/g.62538  ORF Transcript_27442/g.62538 Transcript_27442/m.62538 type:complete len:329 (-) Transcript_27442:9-995(-)